MFHWAWRRLVAMRVLPRLASHTRAAVKMKSHAHDAHVSAQRAHVDFNSLLEACLEGPCDPTTATYPAQLEVNYGKGRLSQRAQCDMRARNSANPRKRPLDVLHKVPKQVEGLYLHDYI